MMTDFWRKMFDSGDSAVEAHLVLVTAGAAVFIALALYHTVILHAAFDPEHYGSGFGYLLAGGGAASWGQGLQRQAQGAVKDDDAGGGDDSAR